MCRSVSSLPPAVKHPSPPILDTDPEFQTPKSAPKTTFKRAKTQVNCGSDPLTRGWSLARLLRIRDLLDFLDFDCF